MSAETGLGCMLKTSKALQLEEEFNFLSLENMQNQTADLRLRWKVDYKRLQSEPHLNLQRRNVEICGTHSHVPG